VAFAHSSNDEGRRQDLGDHLKSVARRCAYFAEPLAAPSAAYLLGLLHDVGKYAPAFQDYLLWSEAAPAKRIRGPDHKAAGALLARERLGTLAMLVQAHHGGLDSPSGFKAWLQERSEGNTIQGALEAAFEELPELRDKSRPPLPAELINESLSAEMFMRMLYSCLVDADYIDTEQHFAGRRAAFRSSGVYLADLWPRFERSQAALSGPGRGEVNDARHAIYQACLAAAEGGPGLYRLTVPTGGGKTRSAMGFALRHARRHGQQRVIVVMPYISITEQTADTYRSIFGDYQGHPVVLEHHSGVETAAEEGEDAGERWRELAAENWDAPIVVTTTVQLFESLFSRSPSRARKVHHLANSVIIIDEAQSLPPGLLEPILSAITELARHYGTTVVMSTATQPAFDAIPAFSGLDAAEMVPCPGRFFERLKRVRYEWHLDPPLGWDEVAAMMRAQRQVLAIVNTKADARALLLALGDPSTLHLSTSLCGAHRRRVIKEVRRRLSGGEPCRLVSTQVVEAGVDIDFPVVFRALGPLDAIIQAAGRCNREGRLSSGLVQVFKPADGGLPRGTYRAATGITGALLEVGNLDPTTVDAARAYYVQLYDTVSTDSQRIQTLRKHLDYPEVAARFRMIEDDTVSAVVEYGSADERQRVEALVAALRDASHPGRATWRALQPYIVSVRRRSAEQYQRQGLYHSLGKGIGVWRGRYDPVCGLLEDDPDPADLIV